MTDAGRETSPPKTRRLPDLFRTGVFQLMLMYMALFGFSVIAIFIFVYWSTIGQLERESDAVIRAELRGLHEQWQRRAIAGLIEVINERVSADPQGQSVYLLVDPNLRRLAGNVETWPRQFDRRGEWVDFLKTDLSGNQSPARGQVIEIEPNYRLLVARETSEREAFRERFGRAATWGFGLTMVLALAGGLLMGLSAQTKLARLSRTTRRIMAGDLSQRIPMSGNLDEYDALASDVNSMLDQIENLLEGLRHVGDSIAHDLRGPLTRLRNKIETMSAESAPSRQGLEECAEQADGLLDTFNALLRIARVESGAYRSAFTSLDLAQITRDVCELYQASAEDRGLALNCDADTSVPVFGDRELLAQALTNLLDNAIKYTPSGGKLDVRLVELDGRAELAVADSGPGVPEAERGRVLNRFARLDQSRSMPGNGLGLALVNAVAEQHAGHLVLADNEPGLIVKLVLPVTGR